MTSNQAPTSVLGGTAGAVAEPRPLARQAVTPTPRVQSIDAVRGLVMFTMIFVNDIAGVSHQIVPWWMRHFKADGNGMTFVDLVFPAFLFIVGMSIPFGLGSRLKRGEPGWRSVLHVVLRTLSLLLVGIAMVNGYPDGARLGWSPALWTMLMYLAAILTFCSLAPPPRFAPSAIHTQLFRVTNLVIRSLGFLSLVLLLLVFRGRDGHRIISFVPFSIHTSWYGILGLIGWAYLVGAVVFLFVGCRRTAILACTVLLFCLYPAAQGGAFDNFWLNHYVGIGSTLGSQAAITVAGVLLASILITPETASVRQRLNFTFWFVAACAAGALLLHPLYGINKNSATPSWCLWACAITAVLWSVFYLLCDVRSCKPLAKTCARAGENVLLAYLLSNLLPSSLDWLRLDGWYSRLAEPNLAFAVGRSAGCAIIILLVTAWLNRAGFRLRL